MSIRMNLDTVVETLVEVLMPRGSDRKKLLVLDFLISATATTNDQQREVQRRAVFLFHRPGNYTKVLWKTSVDLLHKRLEDFAEWQVVADHDSCWRSDGVADSLRSLESELEKSLRGVPGDQNIVATFSFAEPHTVVVKDYDYDERKRIFTITW